MDIRRVGGLEIAEDMRLERATWTAQRIGWAVLLVIVLAAVAGLCGSSGPLGDASAGAEDGPIRVTYARFPRHASPLALEVELGRDTVANGRARFWISPQYLDRFTIDTITPEPETVEVAPDRLTFSFAVADRDGPLRVQFSMRPDAYWRHRARIGVPDGPTLRFTQFVYP